MRVVITGGRGFLGWHAAVRLHTLHGIEAVRLGREETDDPKRLSQEVAAADVILHLAGVNRAESEVAVHEGNVSIARSVAAAVEQARRPIRVVYADSIQAEAGTPYGIAKAEAANVLQEAVTAVHGSLADVMLPNLFGEHGRPHYNSFVATFCDLVARGESPTVADDKEVPLLHVQSAAQHLIEAMSGDTDAKLRPTGSPHLVSTVLELIVGFHELYSRGDIPAIDDPFLVDLFNTYRSFLFPHDFPRHPQVNADARGELFETARTHGGAGQAFVSTTRPGATRGDHYHLRKIERFFVVQGEAEIAVRRLLDDTVVRFRLSGSKPGFVDMPTMWVHNISNVGDSDLVTMFWSDQLLDPDNPDQYPERVESLASA